MRCHETPLAFGIGIANDQVIPRGDQIRRHRPALLTEPNEAGHG
jgi:hypothetical protein